MGIAEVEQAPVNVAPKQQQEEGHHGSDPDIVFFDNHEPDEVDVAQPNAVAVAAEDGNKAEPVMPRAIDEEDDMVVAEGDKKKTDEDASPKRKKSIWQSMVKWKDKAVHKFQKARAQSAQKKAFAALSLVKVTDRLFFFQDLDIDVEKAEAELDKYFQHSYLIVDVAELTKSKYPNNVFEKNKLSFFEGTTFEGVLAISQAATKWWKADPSNVIVLFAKERCHARVCACSLYYAGAVKSAVDGLQAFHVAVKNRLVAEVKKRNLLPSEKRFLKDFVAITKGLGPEEQVDVPELILTHIIIHKLPAFDDKGTRPMITIIQEEVSRFLYSSISQKGSLQWIASSGRNPVTVSVPIGCRVKGGAKIKAYHTPERTTTDNPRRLIFEVPFHTLVAKMNNMTILIKKNGIDDGAEEHMLHRKFRIELVFAPAPPIQPLEDEDEEDDLMGQEDEMKINGAASNDGSTLVIPADMEEKQYGDASPVDMDAELAMQLQLSLDQEMNSASSSHTAQVTDASGSVSQGQTQEPSPATPATPTTTPATPQGPRDAAAEEKDFYTLTFSPDTSNINALDAPMGTSPLNLDSGAASDASNNTSPRRADEKSQEEASSANTPQGSTPGGPDLVIGQQNPEEASEMLTPEQILERDELLARQLQEEFNREAEQGIPEARQHSRNSSSSSRRRHRSSRSSSRHRHDREHSPSPFDSFFNMLGGHAHSRNASDSAQGQVVENPEEQLTADERFARELQAQLNLEAEAPAYRIQSRGISIHDMLGRRRRGGASSNQIDALPEFECTGGKFLKEECQICRDKFEVGDVMRTLPCIHSYHKECVDRWLRINRSCPVCTRRIDED